MSNYKPAKRYVNWILGGFALTLVAVFQNCAGSFQASIAPFDSSSLSSNNGLGSVVIPPEGPEKIETVSSCVIPAQASTLLSQTCLGKYAARLRAGAKFDNFIEFEPQYPLFSDSADKRRWLYLPAGSKINSADPDNWKFPKGSILYKEFSLDGRLIETRQMEKIGDGDGFANWRFTAYANLADNSDSVPTTNSFNEQNDADFQRYAAFDFKSRYSVGTPNKCMACHGSAADSVRGFSYLQLSSSTKVFNLTTAAERGFLTVIPLKMDEIPGTNSDKAMIGYIQSNCAVCHDGGTGGGNGNFRHLSSALTLVDENIFKRAIASPGLIKAGHPETSRLYARFSSGSMPPAEHHKTIHQAMVVQMAQWITALPEFMPIEPSPTVPKPVISSFRLQSPNDPVPSISPAPQLQFSWSVTDASIIRLKLNSQVDSLDGTINFAGNTSGALTQNLCYLSRSPYEGQMITEFEYTLEAENSLGEKVTLGTPVVVHCVTSAPEVQFVKEPVSDVVGYTQPGRTIRISWDVQNSAYTQIVPTIWSDDLMTMTLPSEPSGDLSSANYYDFVIPSTAKYLKFIFKTQNAAGKVQYDREVHVPVGPIRFATPPPPVVWINVADNQVFYMPARLAGGSSNNSSYILKDDTGLIITHGGFSPLATSIVGWWQAGSPRERDYTAYLYYDGGIGLESGTLSTSVVIKVVNGCASPQRVRLNTATNKNECYTP